MHRIPGIRAGTQLYEHGGYTYYRDPTMVETFRCTLRIEGIRCPGAVFVADNTVHIYRGHFADHLPDPRLRDEILFRRELYRRCRETLMTFEEIYRDVSAT